MSTHKLEIVQVLEKYPDGALVEELMKERRRIRKSETGLTLLAFLPASGTSYG